jgi:hypothetical protein
MRGRSARLLAAGLLVVSACGPGTGPTAVSGFVMLGDADSGDVRGSVVELRRTHDIADPAAYSVTVDSGALFYRSGFVIEGVEPDSYLVLSWKDVNGDDSISDGDLVGVYVGSYGRNRFGSFVAVAAGETASVGTLELGRLRQLVIEAWGARSDSGRATTFAYRFNHDVDMELMTVAFPGGDTLTDPSGTGHRLADSSYTGTEWRRAGSAMPAGWHGLVFRGRTASGWFTKAASVFIR